MRARNRWHRLGSHVVERPTQRVLHRAELFLSFSGAPHLS